MILNFGKESVRSSFGVRSGSVRDPFWSIPDQNFGSKNLKISKTFNLCSRRRRGRGPLAVIPSPAAWRAPAAAATAAQIEIFVKQFPQKAGSIMSRIYSEDLEVVFQTPHYRAETQSHSLLM